MLVPGPHLTLRGLERVTYGRNLAKSVAALPFDDV
jgi:hypothetical protein